MYTVTDIKHNDMYTVIDSNQKWFRVHSAVV
jgi:hypothetical protein